MPTTIGLISDTHGLLRPEAVEALRGVDLIFHAGDVGGRDVLIELGEIAPVRAVCGNVDDPHTPGLASTVAETIDGRSILVLHGHLERRLAPEVLLGAHDADIIVFGHTHRAVLHRSGQRLVVNPGAAGPRRFDIVPSVARLVLTADAADVTHVPLA